MPAPERDLAALVSGARKGDASAVAALTTLFAGLVRGSAARITTNPDDLDDITQQTWLIFMRRIDSIRTVEALPGWLATTARREALRVVRERRKVLPLEGHTERTEDLSESPEDHAVRQDVEDRVHRALARLPHHQARLLIAVVAERRPYREIARELGCPVGSLGPLRARYLKHLSAQLTTFGFTAA